MKNEVGEEIITEFVALSPKSYAYKYCEKEVKKNEGGFPFSFRENDGFLRL